MANKWKIEYIRPQEQVLISVTICGYCWTVHCDMCHVTLLVQVKQAAGRVESRKMKAKENSEE